MKKKYYVAYGSNLNISQMDRRCPTAIIYGKGILKNWTLTFRSMRGPAYATIEQSSGSIVPVVVWEIDRRSEAALDTYEGYPHFYYKKNVAVEMISGNTILGMVYIMNPCAVLGTPTYSYIKTIQEGYLVSNLNIDCLEHLYSNIISNCVSWLSNGSYFVTAVTIGSSGGYFFLEDCITEF